MNERKYLLLALLLFSLTALAGFYLTKVTDLRLWGKKVFVDYQAEIKLQRELGLEETFVYHVKSSNFRMLYRTWRTPLTYKFNLGEPFVKLKDILEDSGYDWYIKDFYGRVYGSFESEASKKLAKTLAERNEVGIVNPNYFNPGTYALKVSYGVYPQVEIGDGLYHVNLKLADRHAFYRKVKIKIDDVYGVIEKIYPHVTNWKLKKEGNTYVITGLSPANRNVGVEFLFKPISMWGFQREFPGIELITDDANEGLFTVRFIYEILKKFLFFAVVVYPVFFYLLYLKFGKEREFLVPKFLSCVPNPNRKPYQVNLLFAGDASFADENALFSTVLDLKRRGILEVKREFGNLILKIVKENKKLDGYEAKVLDFIKVFGTKDSDGNWVLDLGALKNKIDWWRKEKSVEELEWLKKWLDALMNYSNQRMTDSVLDRKGLNVLAVFGIVILVSLIALVVANRLFNLSDRFFVDFYPIYVYLGVLSFNWLAFSIFFPSQLLGRWKKDFYREKLMWDAFKNFLSDFAMLKKYAPEDVSIWKEWLVYGTALGVADKVEEALKQLSVEVPEIREFSSVGHDLNSSFVSCRSSVSSALSSSSGSSGGSFGGGGGFGGGGAGAR